MAALRDSKKRETRQRLSDVATKLFYARGFEAVTIEEIAGAARVSKPTVFNYFARKEDLFFDREEELRQRLEGALARRLKRQSPVEALRQLAHHLSEEKHPFARIDQQTLGWWRVVAASPSLQARLRAVSDETVEFLAVALGGAEPDGATRLVAGAVVLTWRTAYAQAIRDFEAGASVKTANAVFIALIERGFAGVQALARSRPRRLASALVSSSGARSAG